MKIQPQIFLSVILFLLVLAIAQTTIVKTQLVSSPKQENAPVLDPRPLIPAGGDPLLLLKSSSAEQREDASIYLLRSHENVEDKVQATAEMFLKQSAERIAQNPHDPANQEGNQDDHGAKDAIVLMGEFRSLRSVSFLVAHLSFFIFEMRSQSLSNAYPCTGSLIAIGSPSLDPLLVKVAQTDDPLTTRLAAYVFVKVLGQNVAAAFIEDRRSKLTDSASKRRLEQLAHIVRTEKFPY